MPAATPMSAIEAQPLIAVRDVRASSRWYSKLLGVSGAPEHPHRDAYDRLSSGERVVLQLHAWDEEDRKRCSRPTRLRFTHLEVLGAWGRTRELRGVRL